MWYLIISLLFGQGGNSAHNGHSKQPMMQMMSDHGGERDTPRPPKNT